MFSWGACRLLISIIDDGKGRATWAAVGIPDADGQASCYQDRRIYERSTTPMCAIGTGRAMLYWSAERRQNDNMVVAFATFLHRGWGNERSGPSGTSLEGKLRARHAHWCVAIAWAIVGSCRRYDVHWPEAFVLFYRGVVVVELLSRCCFGEKGTSGRPPRQKYTSIKMPTQLCMTTNVGIKFAKTLKGVCKDVKGHVQRRKRAAPAYVWVRYVRYRTVDMVWSVTRRWIFA